MIDESSVLDFLEFGLVSPDRDLVLHNRILKLDDEPVYTQSTYNLDNVIDILQQSLEKAVCSITTERCKSFALSGGIDSRLILCILTKNHNDFLKEIKIYNRYHPQLGPVEDRDSILAKQVCNFLDLKLDFEAVEEYGQDYLRFSSPKGYFTLSGLWGGELLGGALHQHFPFALQEIDKTSRVSPLKDYILKIKDNFPGKISELWLMFHLLRNSRHTAFYRSIGWYEPKYVESIAATPFLGKEFLENLFRLPIDEINNYKIYKKLVNKYDSKLFSFPINNISFKDNQTLPGKEPKKEAAYIQREGKITTEAQLQILEICKRHSHLPYANYLMNLIPFLTGPLSKI